MSDGKFDAQTWDDLERKYNKTGGPSSSMTLRDWFAGQALTGWLASNKDAPKDPQNLVAELCYGLADAMLAARK